MYKRVSVSAVSIKDKINDIGIDAIPIMATSMLMIGGCYYRQITQGVTQDVEQMIPPAIGMITAAVVSFVIGAFPTDASFRPSSDRTIGEKARNLGVNVGLGIVIGLMAIGGVNAYNAKYAPTPASASVQFPGQ